MITPNSNMTDTPKRLLSDVELEEIRLRSARQYSRMQLNAEGDACGTIANPWEATRDVDALLSHIAALTAPPSQGKVERARELLAQAYERAGLHRSSECIRNGGELASVQQGLAIAAITQALTESSGQGTDGACCEAMREKAAKAICPLCAKGFPIDPGTQGYEQFKGYHIVDAEADDGLPNWEECFAATIHALPIALRRHHEE